jgi:hypothetical protein
MTVLEMLRHVALGVALLATPIASVPTRANDTSAALATGGLVFVRNPDVAMRSEWLLISPTQIEVRYVFFNHSGHDVTNLVAFPMPDITISGPVDNIAIPTENAENIVDFTTTVDGRPVTAEVRQKVFARGIDRTELLHQWNVPLAPHVPATGAALDRLAQDDQRRLIDLGLAEVEEYDAGKGMEKHLAPRWTLKTTYFWQQTFPAQRELVIVHRYRPSLGESAGTSLGEPGWAGLAEYRRKYCIEDDFLRAVERARRVAHSSYGAPFSEQHIEYVLSTGANWRGPIGEFTLVVDMGGPTNLVSFCAEGVRRISPTKFEVHSTNFTPPADLAVLILKPQRQ